MSTKFGQILFVSGNNSLLGNDDLTQAFPLKYFNEDFWQGKVEIAEKDFNAVVELKLPKYMEQAQLMLVFTAIETKNVEGAKVKIQELEKQPYYSYKELLLKVEKQLEEK